MGYISTNDQQSLGERYLMTALIIVVLGFSSLICLLAPMFFRVKPQLVETVNWTNFLYTIALLMGLAVVLIRRVLLSRVMLGGAARQGSNAVLARLSVTSIVCGVLGEMVGILGLVGYLVTGESFGWPVGIISILLIIYSFPRKREWIRSLENTEAPSPVDSGSAIL
ncbi:MAG: hypothetical protein ABI882_22385 [Acidobacteriota bacterium]